MKWIPLIPPGAHLNPIELEEWIRGMKMIFAMVEVAEDKNVNIGIFYSTREADIWWNTLNHKCQESELTWEIFFKELRTQFYPVTLQRQ